MSYTEKNIPILSKEQYKIHLISKVKKLEPETLSSILAECNFFIGYRFYVFLYIYIYIYINCLKCRKNTEIKNSKIAKTKNGRIMLLSRCSVCNTKKSKFSKKQKATGLLSSLLIRTPFSQIPLLGALLL